MKLSRGGWSGMIQTIKNINDATGNMIKISPTADKTLTTLTYVTKFIGISIGTAGVTKGTVDMLKGVAYKDRICAVVSGIGVCADGLSMAVSFIPDPNLTTVVTVPVSVGCKVFVYCRETVKEIPSYHGIGGF